MTDLVEALRRAGVADVDDSVLARALYTSDASLYRVEPRVVARPRHPDEMLAALAVAREHGVPLTARGAGTSIAGNAVGPGIVLDLRRHLGRVLLLDSEARTATVQPGVVLDALQATAAPHGLRFGPDPSTHSRCTIGGMIGNNACGSRALGYGRTSDNVAGLRVAFGNGEVASIGGFETAAERPPQPSTQAALLALADAHLGHIRPRFGTFSRQVSGYALEHLLPERGRRLDRFLVGSEGTLGLVLEATVDLVPETPGSLMVLGYPTMADAADAVPALLGVGGLLACEGMDARLVECVRRAGRTVPELPRGSGWLMVEVPPSLVGAVRAAGEALDSRVVDDEAEAAALWRIREDGAGLAARSLGGPAYSGWEDAAVPPERLGAWLREFDGLLAAHGLDGVPYGHFGDGCLHVRIDFDFDDGGRRFRAFLLACARALRAYGGSLSGEHGDGRARSELLPLMYDAESLAIFGAVKAICDPDGVLNPGVLVDPRPLDADLRPTRPAPLPLGPEAHRCTGVGRCVAPATTGVMCPSYLATGEEKDSTRGRARVLQEALDGTLVRGLADPAVTEALDLCVACKGCASDCPTGVDLASYKAEVLDTVWRGRRRPRSHYTLGRLPDWLRRTPGWAVPLARFGPVEALAKRVAGIDRRRSLPPIARSTPGTSSESRAIADGSHDVPGAQPDVAVWVDTFTRHFRPGLVEAALTVLDDAGVSARVLEDDGCCALTWVTTGQLDQARTRLGRTLRTLASYDVPVVGLEPSCLATLRDDGPRLVPDAPRPRLLTLAELLTERGWQPPDLTGVEVVAQPHCHHASVLGWQADAALLTRAGARLTRVAGCCGLAGNFGMEQGHYEVSVAMAETHLLPAVRAAGPAAVVLADGLSCRHQLTDLAEVRSMHLAELLASRITG
ncbi:MAG: FAD-binding and (Fe-S)-binding domain-containing protein [Nocardioides sp.]